MAAMPSFLVELYLPAATAERREAIARAARAVASADVRYLRSIFLPEEDTCFHEYESANGDVLAALLAHAELPYQRLIEATVVA